MHWQDIDPVNFILDFADRIYHVDCKDTFVRKLDGRVGRLGSHLAWDDPRRGWTFVSTGRGQIDWESSFRALNSIGYKGPISVEWEDAGMDRLHGAKEAVGFVKSLPATQSRYVTEFYQNSKQISQAYADMRHYAELGESDKVNQILDEQGDKIALSKSYDKAAKDMAKVRQVISFIRSDETMSGSEKKEEIDRLKLLIDEIAKQMEDVRRDLKN
jgi:hypothetical protein